MVSILSIGKPPFARWFFRRWMQRSFRLRCRMVPTSPCRPKRTLMGSAPGSASIARSLTLFLIEHFIVWTTRASGEDSLLRFGFGHIARWLLRITVSILRILTNGSIGMLCCRFLIVERTFWTCKFGLITPSFFHRWQLYFTQDSISGVGILGGHYA